MKINAMVCSVDWMLGMARGGRISEKNIPGKGESVRKKLKITPP